MSGEVTFDKRGLVPAVLQHVESGEVLMVAWMNREALRLTRETGQAHFWSRSRETLWHKGATSGNVMHVRDMWIDCDGDTLLVRVHPAGPACHTGERSCFYRRMGPAQDTAEDLRYDGADDSHGILDELFDVILERKEHRPPGSYTTKLFEAGPDEILKKVGEEAIEVLLAAKSEGDKRLVSELADLAYHLLVLLASRDLRPDDVGAELAERRREPAGDTAREVR